MKKILLLCAVLAVGVSAPAFAGGLVLDKIIVDFKANEKPIDNIKVTNQSDRPLKVTAKVIESLNIEQPNQQEVATDNLIVAPKAFELQPGESRPVRLVLKKFSDDREMIYRVRFTPDAPTVTKEQQAEGKSVKIDIIVSMGALITVAPKNPKPDVTFKRQGDKIIFTNSGNVTAQLQRMEYCTDDKKICAPLDGKRIYPGTTWEMVAPDALKALPFTQTMLVNEQYSTLSYPAP